MSTYITPASSPQQIKETLKKCFQRGVSFEPLPPLLPLDLSVPHAPVRTPKLNAQQFKVNKIEIIILKIKFIFYSYIFCFYFVKKNQSQIYLYVLNYFIFYFIIVSKQLKMHYVIFQPIYIPH
jgi:hypothetical protein